MDFRTTGLAALTLALAACAGGEGDEATTGDSAGAAESDGRPAAGEAPGDTEDRRAFSEIGPDETVHFTGTEPFWGGQASGKTLTYSTPENIDGTQIAVERFAGRGGLSYSGQYQGAPFDMAITPGQCSDGMSDRTYPYTVTLSVKGEQRQGCAWTEDNPATSPPGYET